MKFEKIEGEKDIQEVLKVGMKVDVFDDGMKKWLPGVIKEFERVSSKMAKILVSKEGMPEDTKERVVWPKPDKVVFCGLKLPKRDCGKDTPEKPIPIQIAFGVEEGPQGYILDKGEVFGKRNEQEYGWSIDATKNGRIREQAEGIENQLMLFPPDG